MASAVVMKVVMMAEGSWDEGEFRMAALRLLIALVRSTAVGRDSLR